MNLRRSLLNLFILIALFVGCLCGVREDRKVQVLERAGTMIMIASWPLALEEIFPGARAHGWLAPELISAEPAPWPGGVLRALPGAEPTLRSRAVALLLSFAIRADLTLGTRGFRTAIGAVAGPGRKVLLVAPQIRAEPLPSPRGDLLPGLLFSAYLQDPTAAESALLPVQPASQLAGLLDGAAPSAGGGPWVFQSQFLDNRFYPSLPAGVAGEPVQGMLDGSRIVLRYRVPGAQVSAYCLLTGAGNTCGTTAAAFGAEDRAVFERWEMALPPLREEQDGTRALALLQRCERGPLPEESIAYLKELVVARRAFRFGTDSMMPYLLRRCGTGVGEAKLAGIGSFWGRSQLVKSFQFTPAATLAAGILGAPVPVGEGAEPGEGENWFSDYRRLFGTGFYSWVERSARNVPGLDPRAAPSERALAVLVAVLSIGSSHYHDEISRGISRALLSARGLSSAELEWIRRNLPPENS